MAAPGTSEELPHPGSHSSRNLEDESSWLLLRGFQLLCEQMCLNCCKEKLSLTQSSTPKTGSFQRQCHPPGQTILKRPRPKRFLVSLPHCPPSNVIAGKLWGFPITQSPWSGRTTLQCHREQWIPSLKQPRSWTCSVQAICFCFPSWT